MRSGGRERMKRRNAPRPASSKRRDAFDTPKGADKRAGRTQARTGATRQLDGFLLLAMVITAMMMMPVNTRRMPAPKP
jgi:hypothetical protein